MLSQQVRSKTHTNSRPRPTSKEVEFHWLTSLVRVFRLHRKEIVPRYAIGLLYNYGGLWYILNSFLAYLFENFMAIKYLQDRISAKVSEMSS